MKRASISVVLSLCSGCVIPYSHCTPVVEGVAVDSETKAAVPAVRAWLVDYPDTATTGDGNGQFATAVYEEWFVFSMPLSDRCWTYELQLSADGYLATTREVRVFRVDFIDVGVVELVKEDAEP